MPTDGWGSSAMLYALIEGLAGIEDLSCLFRSVRLSPRWISAACKEVEVSVSYAASGAGLAYAYVHRPEQRTIALEVRGNAEVALHLQLPAGTRPAALRVNGRTVRHRASRVEQSCYANAAFPVRGNTNVIVEYR